MRWFPKIFYMFGYVVLLFFILYILSGCCTSGAQPSQSFDSAREGYIAIGRLEQINSDLERIQQRSGEELERITATSDDLGKTIYELIDFAQRLLEENNNLRGELEKITEELKNSMVNSNPSVLN